MVGRLESRGGGGGSSTYIESVKSVLHYCTDAMRRPDVILHVSYPPCRVSVREEGWAMLCVWHWTHFFACSLFAAVCLTSVSFSLCTLKARQQLEFINKNNQNNQNNEANWQITPTGMLLCLVCAITKLSFISSLNRRSDFELNWQNTAVESFLFYQSGLWPQMHWSDFFSPNTNVDTSAQSLCRYQLSIRHEGCHFPKFKTLT